MDKKKIIAAIAAISLTTGVAGFATACGGEDEPAAPPHNHTYSTEWTAGENTHWHESTCEHTGLKEEGSEAPHIDEDDDKLCDVCDYDMREVIVVTVAEVKGGTVTLDKTQPKYGDTVTATVQANTGYIFKSVKLGEEVKTLDENGKFTFTATDAVTITAEFEGKTIALDTSAVETANGAVAFKFPDGKTEYKFGENVMLEVTTDDYYRLSALYINGDTKVNYADSISNEGLVLVPNCEYEKLTITAEFIVGYRDITVNFKGRRMGVENITFDADCGLTVSGYSDITIQDSATKLIKAEVGKSYNVSVPNGWQSASFKVGDADEYDVTLEWAPKLRYPEHSANMDLSRFNDGYITSTSDMCDLGLYTEAFIGDNAMLTVNFSSKDFSPTNDYKRQFAGFMFDRDSKWFSKNIAAHLIFEGATATNNRLEWNGNKSMWDSSSLVENWWSIDGSYCNPLSSAMLAKYMSDAGIDLTVVRRNGNEFLIFLDGTYVGGTTLGEEYIGKLASPMIVSPRLTNGNRIDYSFTEDKATIDKFLTSTIKVSANSVFSEGVSVTAAKASDAFKEAVTLTVTVPQGSVLTEFVVDGEDLLSGVTDAGVYTFTSWRKGGEHEFVIKAIAMDASESIDQTVKMNVADGTKVRFVRSGETTVEKTFEDGEVTFNGKVGAWKVQIFGFNTWLNVGSISVNGAEKTLDVGSIFNVGAASASGYVYDLAAGTMTWHGKSRPDMRLNVDHTVGQDMWIVTKVKLPAAALNQIKTVKLGLGMSYGLGFKTAEKEVHVDLYSEGAQHSYLMVNDVWKDTEKLGYWSDFLHGTAGDLQNGKYANAMVGDGVYLIERYNATTGKTEYWAGEDLQTLTLVFTYNSFNTLGTGALITTAGIYGGQSWSPGIDANFDCTIGIGSTLEAALGVAGKTVAVNVTGDKSEDGSVTYCTVNVPEFTAGNTAVIEITPSADYNIKSVKINNRAVNFEYDEVENKLRLSIDRFCYTTLDIQITAEEVVKVDVNATITAKQQAIVSSINGKAFTLTDGLAGVYNGNVTNDGKIQISDVKIGTYTLKIDGYFDKQVEVTKSGMADVTVEYVFMTDNGKADLTNMNDPTQKITWKDTSGNINMNTVDKYDDVYAKAHFDPFTLGGGDFRATINLQFGNGKSARIDLNIEKNYGAAKLQSTEWDTFFGKWNTKYTLTADELNSIKENGVDFTIVRKGSHVYILLNDVIKFDFELTEKDGFNYATAKAGLNIQYCQDQERDKNHGLTLDVRGTIPEEIADKIAEKESAA